MKYFLLSLLLSTQAFAAGKIINADIAASGTANIARNKLAASTAHNACTFDNSGFIAGGVAPGASGNVLQSNGTDWTSVASTAALSIGALDAQAANANGLALVSNVLTTQSADATNPGVVNNTTQTLSGAKTFSSAPTFSTMTSKSVLFAGASGLLSQDNSNFGYDSTNHALLIGTTTVGAVGQQLTVKGVTAASSGILAVYAQSGNGPTILQTSNGGFAFLQNNGKNLLNSDNAGHVGLTACNANGTGNLDSNCAQSVAGENTHHTLGLYSLAAQTGKLLNFYGTAGTTVGDVDVTGKGTFANLKDTAISTAGLGRFDASGNIASSAELSADVTTSGSNATTVAKIQGTTVSGTTGTTNVVFSTSPTMSNPVVGTQTQADNSTKAASTAYVDTGLATKASSTLTNTNILVGNGSNVATSVAMSGDATIANTGAVTLKNTGPGAGSFTSANITIDNQGRITAAASGGGGGGSLGLVCAADVPTAAGWSMTPTTSYAAFAANGSAYVYNATAGISTCSAPATVLPAVKVASLAAGTYKVTVLSEFYFTDTIAGGSASFTIFDGTTYGQLNGTGDSSVASNYTVIPQIVSYFTYVGTQTNIVFNVAAKSWSGSGTPTAGIVLNQTGLSFIVERIF